MPTPSQHIFISYINEEAPLAEAVLTERGVVLLPVEDYLMDDAHKLSPQAQQTISLFKEQLGKLSSLRLKGNQNPLLISWRNATEALFSAFLPDSTHYGCFVNIMFGGGYSVVPSIEDMASGGRDSFLKGCDLAEQCIKGAIEELERFDLPVTAQKIASFVEFVGNRWAQR